MKKFIIESFGTYANKSGKKFWGDVASGVLPISNKTKRILLNYRSKYVNEPHTYGIYGGKLDDGETDVKESVLREFKEETEYNGNVKLIDAYIYKADGGGFEYHNFIGIIDDEFIPEYDWESEGHIWLTYDELIEMRRISAKKLHFGLVALIDNSGDLIKKNTTNL